MRLPDDLMAALGRLAVAWARFDYELGCLFAEATKMPVQTGLMVYYSSGGFAAHRDLLKAAIADMGWKAPPPALLDILSRADDLNTLRNDLLHGDWLRYANGVATVSVVKPRSSDRLYAFDTTTGEITAYTEQIATLTDQLSGLDLAPIVRSRPRHGDKNPPD
jgi:hypothetical protein